MTAKLTFREKLVKFLVLYIVGFLVFALYVMLAQRPLETVLLEFLQATGLGIVVSALLVWAE